MKKKGDLIELAASGKEYIFLFDVVAPTGGKGAARKWKGITDDMWKILFDSLADYSTKDRNEVCTFYGVSYQKLIKMFGDNADIRSPVRKAAAGNPLARIELIKTKISKHQASIVELEKELSELKSDGIELLKKQMEDLENM